MFIIIFALAIGMAIGWIASYHRLMRIYGQCTSANPLTVPHASVARETVIRQ